MVLMRKKMMGDGLWFGQNSAAEILLLFVLLSQLKIFVRFLL